jgi:O-antigen/teichoic acid export membrane protein
MSGLRLVRLAKATSALSIVDQAFISGGNFASGVVLARALPTTDFGLFVVANFGLLLALAMQNGLTLQPLVIRGAALPDPGFRRFLRASLPIQAVFITSSTLLVAAVALLWEPLRPLALPLAAAAALTQGQEFCRRALYTRGHLHAAMLNNVTNYDLQALLLAAVALSGALSLLVALWIVALTSALAVLLGLCQLRRFATPDSDNFHTVLHQTLQIGKWTGPSVVLVSASAEAYPALVTALAGLPSAAGMGAIRQVISPVHLLSRPLENYHLPRAAHALAHQGTDGLNRVLWQAGRVTAPGYLLYVLVLAIMPGWVLGTIYGDRYIQFAQGLQVFALAYALQAPVQILKLEINARRLQRHLFLADMWVVIVVYSLGLHLITQLGLVGAGLTTVVAYAGQCAFLAIAVARARRMARHDLAQQGSTVEAWADA